MTPGCALRRTPDSPGTAQHPCLGAADHSTSPQPRRSMVSVVFVDDHQRHATRADLTGREERYKGGGAACRHSRPAGSAQRAAAPTPGGAPPGTDTASHNRAARGRGSDVKNTPHPARSAPRQIGNGCWSLRLRCHCGLRVALNNDRPDSSKQSHSAGSRRAFDVTVAASSRPLWGRYRIAPSSFATWPVASSTFAP